jgi:peptidoglycan/xylan/chitin deacetylase (PgdA/CDA1 family)
MNYIRHLISSKGLGNLLSRAFMIYRRFGLTSAKSKKAIEQIFEITNKYKCTPSFFVTAELLEHHLDLFARISENGTHVGLHGCHHIDYVGMSEAEQRNDITKGLNKFREHNMQVSGFRAPFLRFNEETAKAVVDSGIDWVSHCTMLYDRIAHLKVLERHDNAKHLVGNFYSSRSHAKEVSLPRWGTHCLEIPVSLPDDELLVDRLGICDPHEFTRIWSDMLNSTREEGELLNLLFHPERISVIAQPLEAILEQATGHGDVWVASLDEIRKWWQQRSGFSLEIAENGDDIFKVTVNCNHWDSLALQHPGGKLEFLTPDTNSEVNIRSNLKPVIAVSPGSSEEDLVCLISEGFVVDPTADPSSCAFVFDCRCKENNRRLLDSLKQARGPLLRFWRWPDRFKSALAITADIDAITIWDFVRRARHFHKIKSP